MSKHTMTFRPISPIRLCRIQDARTAARHALGFDRRPHTPDYTLLRQCGVPPELETVWLTRVDAEPEIVVAEADEWLRRYPGSFVATGIRETIGYWFGPPAIRGLVDRRNAARPIDDELLSQDFGVHS